MAEHEEEAGEETWVTWGTSAVGGAGCAFWSFQHLALYFLGFLGCFVRSSRGFWPCVAV